MTLDPVHVDGVARLATRVSESVAASDHGPVADTAWQDFLDPLWGSPDDEGPLLEPLAEQFRGRVAMEDVALTERPYPTSHGLDAGTINPTTFKNGLVLDVSQAAMAAVPSDIELHRRRTLVMSVHTNDETTGVDGTDWRMGDAGYTRQRLLAVPRVDRFEQSVVHALALYLAESTHALENAALVEDLLVLDGPIYPTGVLTWAERDPELRRLLTQEAQPRAVIENYLALVEVSSANGVPLLGFVKNSASKALTRVLREKLGAPWVDDDAFFRRVLARKDGDGEVITDELTFTCWFRSRLGTDGLIAGDGTELGVDHERSLPEEDYEVTFFVVYDPRDDLVYRVEAPAGMTSDDVLRERLRTQVLSEIAAERGPPEPVAKADELARVDRQAKATLRNRIEREFETEQRERYNDKRWAVVEDVE